MNSNNINKSKEKNEYKNKMINKRNPINLTCVHNVFGVKSNLSGNKE